MSPPILMNTKYFALVLIIASVILHPCSVVAEARYRHMVEAPVVVGWSIRNTGPSSSLMPAGHRLQKHPKYYEFQQRVIDEVHAMIPSWVRNSWGSLRTGVDAEGHMPERRVVELLQGQIKIWNAARIAEAEHRIVVRCDVGCHHCL